MILLQNTGISSKNLSFRQFIWLFILLTYLLTPWSRVLLEELICFKLVKKFPAFTSVPVPVLRPIDQVHTTTYPFLEIHLNIILLSASRCHKWSISRLFLFTYEGLSFFYVRYEIQNSPSLTL
jgi:hypothetical protein